MPAYAVSRKEAQPWHDDAGPPALGRCWGCWRPCSAVPGCLVKILKRVYLPEVNLPSFPRHRLDVQPSRAHSQGSLKQGVHVEGSQWIGKRCWPMSPDQSMRICCCVSSISWQKIASYATRLKDASS